jgi:hypothetical protein
MDGEDQCDYPHTDFPSVENQGLARGHRIETIGGEDYERIIVMTAHVISKIGE